MDTSIIVGIDVGTTKICTLVAREEGADKLRILGVGIEPSHRACQVARDRLPDADIHQGVLGSVDLPERSFEVVTLIDTIYYLPSPLRDLTQISQMLKPKGRLFIEAQNFANRGCVYRWLGHPFDDTWMLVETAQGDLIYAENPGWDVVLAGDIWYESRVARHGLNWLGSRAESGVLVLTGDPGRAFSPSQGMETLATYFCRSVPDLEHPAMQTASVFLVQPTE